MSKGNKVSKEISVKIGQHLKDIKFKTISGMNEATAGDGGNLTGTWVNDEILSQLELNEPIWDLVKKVKAPRGPTVKIRSRINNLAYEPSTGIRTYWVSEGDQATATKIKCEAKNVSLGKLVTYMPVTEELDWDVETLGNAFLEDAVISQVYKIVRDILLGTGTIKGVLASGNGATIGVDVASTIPTEDELEDFIQKLHPNAYANAAWYVTPQLYTGILQINFTTPNVLQFEDGRYYLFGFPIYETPQLVASPNSIVLGDFTKYAVAFTEPKFDKSENLRFLEGENIYRLQIRIGGDTFASTTVCDDGTTYGFFVVDGETPAYESSSSSSSEEHSESSSSSSENHSESSSSSSEDYSDSSVGYSSESSDSSDSSESSSSGV